MNKKIILKSNGILMLFTNIIIFLSLFLFKKIMDVTNCVKLWSIFILIVDSIILCISIYFSIKIISRPNLYDTKKSIKTIIICFIIYILLNIGIIFTVNIKTTKKYSKIANELLDYCKDFNCEKYETKVSDKGMDFVIINSYFDYDGNENSYEIHNVYNDKSVIYIKAVIYSNKQSFSENYIINIIKDYFANFDVELKSTLLKQAFDNRFSNKYVKDNKVLYKVTEIYNKNNLEKLKTQIIVNIKT